MKENAQARKKCCLIVVARSAYLPFTVNHLREAHQSDGTPSKPIRCFRGSYSQTTDFYVIQSLVNYGMYNPSFPVYHQKHSEVKLFCQYYTT